MPCRLGPRCDKTQSKTWIEPFPLFAVSKFNKAISSGLTNNFSHCVRPQEEGCGLQAPRKLSGALALLARVGPRERLLP